MAYVVSIIIVIAVALTRQKAMEYDVSRYIMLSYSVAWSGGNCT